ncbi:MAG TPA: squalene synthase HpnC [Candidatus Acidoferrales bacterium]|nr:squalene synthase HpnC [Candidatus Acidoferrales bacterium]
MAVTVPNGSAGGPQNGEVRPDAVSAGFARLPESYAIPEHAPTLPEAQAYCERLARSHYENFSVASWFLPRKLHQHFFSVYSYCRISDDLGDEVGDTKLSLALLNRWEQELAGTYEKLNNPAAEGSRHPVFIALAETIREFEIPQHEFSDLLVAFRQDQTVSRYQTFDDVLGYCHYSANPVGHLVLYVCGYRDAERQLLSDYTCTALQLANFWQDVAVDWEKNRVYLPLEDLARFGASETEIAERRFTPQFRELMQFEVERAREWFERGLPLVRMVNRELALDLELFSRGGLAILDAIERQDYNVLARRPVVSKGRKMLLLLRALAGKVRA